MFDNYLYVSSTASTFVEHFKQAALSYIDQFNLNNQSLVIDIGSNDGVGLKTFKDHGIQVLGVDPQKTFLRSPMKMEYQHLMNILTNQLLKKYFFHTVRQS